MIEATLTIHQHEDDFSAPCPGALVPLYTRQENPYYHHQVSLWALVNLTPALGQPGLQFSRGCAVTAQQLCKALFLLGPPSAPSSRDPVLLAALWFLGA